MRTRFGRLVFLCLAISYLATPLMAADRVFAGNFEVPIFRGTNLAGMEMNYANIPLTGPVEDTNYPRYDERVIDFYASKGMTSFRFFFSWEGMQSSLNGPIPAAASGNYKIYFDNYKRIVDYATGLGIQVVIEPWDANSGGGAGGARWRGNLVGSAAVPTSAFVDFWKKMATVYKDNPMVAFGLINEPNDMSTMSWWASAQATVTGIRSTGATQRIFVPGNGYTAASTWTNDFYDTAPIQRSNAYGWLHANAGSPITDPLNNMLAEVHTYLDNDEGGGTSEITSVTAARDHLSNVVGEARAQGYQVYLGELGFCASNALAAGAWSDFIDYFNHNQDTLIGYTWWAGGMPYWWDDACASGGGHFAITPTDRNNFTGDSVNMTLIQGDF